MTRRTGLLALVFWTLTCLRWFDAGEPFQPGATMQGTAVTRPDLRATIKAEAAPRAESAPLPAPVVTPPATGQAPTYSGQIQALLARRAPKCETPRTESRTALRLGVALTGPLSPPAEHY